MHGDSRGLRSRLESVMKVNLSSDLAEKVLSLTREYSYAPEEVISIGIALTSVILKERALGNQVVIVAPDGDQVAEFTEIAPQALDSIAEKYIESVYDGITEESVADLVARLEKARDAERLRADEDIVPSIVPPAHDSSHSQRD
jgi:hypothetical protein